MSVERVDYIVRISFTTPPEGSSLSLEMRAEQVMADLMREVSAVSDEAEIVHRRIFEPIEKSSPVLPLLFTCRRCRRVRVLLPRRLCATCWRLTR